MIPPRLFHTLYHLVAAFALTHLPGEKLPKLKFIEELGNHSRGGDGIDLFLGVVVVKVLSSPQAVRSLASRLLR